MPEKRTCLTVKYRRRPLRLSKVLCLEEAEARAILDETPVKKRLLPAQELRGYRKAGKDLRRTCYRACSRAFGHKLETLTEEQRALLLCRFRDGLDWDSACERTGYSESGAMKVLKKLNDCPAR